MKICSVKDIKIITGVMAASMLLGGCSQAAGPSKTEDSKPQLSDTELTSEIKTEFNLKDVSSTPYDQALMDAEYNRYCFDLLRQTIKDYGKDGNVMISPASVMMALDMVAAGAKGETLKQITDLFAANQGPLSQQAYAAAMMDKINGAKNVDFSCANAVWNNGSLLGDGANPDYVSYIQDTFLAEYTVTAFDGDTPGKINSWVDEHTNHMIDKIIENLDPLTVMVLVNAIAFEGKWETPYKEEQVKEGKFTAFDGSAQKAVFLNDTLSGYYESDKATGFLKNYKGGEFAFLAILPKDDSISANEFAENFTAEDYNAFIKSVSYDGEVKTRMPQFKSEFDILLNDTLKNLGVTDVFSDKKADLSGIAGKPGDIYASKVIHKTFIEVDSNGTRAAAATAVTLRTKGVVVVDKNTHVVNCNRPYVYAIVDTKTMTPVFVGTVNQI